MVFASATVENLIHDGKIPPVVVARVQNPTGSSRMRDLGCRLEFSEFLAKEVVPFLQRQYRVSGAAAETGVGGVSRGGLAAVCAALHAPHQFGMVISQSGYLEHRPETSRRPTINYGLPGHSFAATTIHRSLAPRRLHSSLDRPNDLRLRLVGLLISSPSPPELVLKPALSRMRISDIALTFRVYNEGEMPQPGTETIMIVDDEAAVVSLTALMLERYGYHAIAAHNGKEALHLFEVWPDLEVDLVMVDLIMPEMNGVEFVERLRKLRPDVAVLFFSAFSDEEILRPVIARGIPYLAKPFNSISLTRKIRQLLDTPKKADAENA